jgi:hypothetical protein
VAAEVVIEGHVGLAVAAEVVIDQMYQVNLLVEATARRVHY